ncbi:putative nuclease HARBI1 [Cucumis melo var. makuwa]|uniref:Putative nuclease HARBI1 n=1 Tax=Cucumis melo var. makuwa TaxID=1194695 RepID=A0A5D3BYU2_CUCMM|nr:putative nuclease HARBI1 [Cucumis melo var. makuwa]
MDRGRFVILCHLLKMTNGLVETKVVDDQEMVAMFLHILVHYVKNRMIQRKFVQSGEIVSRHFNIVLLAILRLHDELLKKPQLVPNSCTDPRWKCFEMYIKVNVSATDNSRYKTRKGEVAMNVLGVYDMKGNFMFILVGWEGSAGMNFETVELSTGYYYLCDASYLNTEGNSCYLVQVQCQTIMACYLLHNLTNKEITNAEIPDELDEGDLTYATIEGDDIDYIETSNE